MNSVRGLFPSKSRPQENYEHAATRKMKFHGGGRKKEVHSMLWCDACGREYDEKEGLLNCTRLTR